jgi:hypothetical protein
MAITLSNSDWVSSPSYRGNNVGTCGVQQEVSLPASQCVHWSTRTSWATASSQTMSWKPGQAYAHAAAILYL